ncbi:hypothetical protein [Nonomuraea sp. NPDC049725]|uniref:hypothetical protein n=1 Tax=Nonomuraea sp. NPDC049725 TaxID=3154508 RepID=UPI00341E6D23
MTGRRHTPTDLTTPDAATGAAPSAATDAATGAATEAATGAVAGARTGAAVRADAVPDPDAPGKWRGRVSVVQVAGGAMAALTAAVAASWLGVAGTVIGAAVMSVATTVGTELYTHYLRRTRAKVRQHTVTGRRHRPSDRARPSGSAHPSDQARPTDQAPAGRGRVGWLRLGGAAALVFTLSFGGILIYQAIAGQTVSEQLKGATEGKAEPAGRDAAKDRRTEPALRHSRPYPVSPTPSGTPSPTPSATGPLATPTASATVTATAPSPTDAPTDQPAAPPAQEPTDRPATPAPTGAEPTEPPPPAPSPSAPLSGLLPFP